MAVKIIGTTSGVEIDGDSDKNLRVVNRCPAFGALGVYSLDTVSGTMAAGLAAASPVYSVRWGDATRLALIQKIFMSMWDITTGFAAGLGKFEVMFARGFSGSDSSGNSILPSGNMNKRRTSMGTTLFTDMRQSSTATLTAGTRTLDTNPLRQVNFQVSTTANAVMLATTQVYGLTLDGEHPLILAQNEGIVIRATVPATGTWGFNVALDWMEVAAY